MVSSGSPSLLVCRMAEIALPKTMELHTRKYGTSLGHPSMTVSPKSGGAFQKILVKILGGHGPRGIGPRRSVGRQSGPPLGIPRHFSSSLSYFSHKKSARHRAMRRKTPVSMPPSNPNSMRQTSRKKSAETAFLPKNAVCLPHRVYSIAWRGYFTTEPVKMESPFLGKNGKNSGERAGKFGQK